MTNESHHGALQANSNRSGRACARLHIGCWARRPTSTRTEASTEGQQKDREQQRRLVDAFLAASRKGDLQGVIALLDPGVVFRSDPTAERMGGAAELRGAEAVARTFKGRAQAAQPALIDGSVGLIVAPRGKLLLLLRFKFQRGSISEIEAIADPGSVSGAELGSLS